MSVVVLALQNRPGAGESTQWSQDTRRTTHHPQVTVSIMRARRSAVPSTPSLGATLAKPHESVHGRARSRDRRAAPICGRHAAARLVCHPSACNPKRRTSRGRRLASPRRGGGGKGVGVGGGVCGGCGGGGRMGSAGGAGQRETGACGGWAGTGAWAQTRISYGM